MKCDKEAITRFLYIQKKKLKSNSNMIKHKHAYNKQLLRAKLHNMFFSDVQTYHLPHAIETIIGAIYC